MRATPTDVPFTPPKKKPSVFWYVGAALLLLVLVFLYQLFGPSPQIIVSPQTTHITSPLGPGGQPNYEKFVLDQYRAGVTPDNNAATLLWPALWPGELDPAHYATVAAELGLDGIPSPADALVPIHQRISDWLMQQQQPEAADTTSQSPFDLQHESDELLTRVTSRSWTSEQYPWLAKWVEQNESPLDQLLAASRRSRCYFPSPTMLNKEQDSLFAILLPGAQGVRECSRSLAGRAMWHVGERRPVEAWHDLLALHRIGRLTAQGETLIEQLVGFAIANVACQGTLTLLDDGKPSADEARKIVTDLATLPRFAGVADCLDGLERLGYVDTVTRIGGGDFSDRDLTSIGIGKDIGYVRYLSIDWNIVLRKGNAVYDRYVTATRLPTFDERRRAFAKLDQDMQKFARRADANTVLAATLSPAARSDVVASIMIDLIVPAMEAAAIAQDRANAAHDLARLAAALAVYHAEHDAYPENLDDLVPSVLEKLPADIFTGQPYIYRPTNEGYLLYAAGPNCQDDGGSDNRHNIFEGHLLNDLDPAEAEAKRQRIPSGADDLPIRVPRPPARSQAEMERLNKP